MRTLFVAAAIAALVVTMACEDEQPRVSRALGVTPNASCPVVEDVRWNLPCYSAEEQELRVDLVVLDPLEGEEAPLMDDAVLEVRTGNGSEFIAYSPSSFEAVFVHERWEYRLGFHTGAPQVTSARILAEWACDQGWRYEGPWTLLQFPAAAACR